ncbi:jg26647 [Pararge aegeria aegeria]|uniref:Jg26647 protein n=1 Tax=Pararge aegeria aegeria TaxID=348720 RepID=A0A8S4R1G7_9NEOP|nr:jg26647 [Pararge aegeria aegeria]
MTAARIWHYKPSKKQLSQTTQEKPHFHPKQPRTYVVKEKHPLSTSLISGLNFDILRSALGPSTAPFAENWRHPTAISRCVTKSDRRSC